MPKQADTLDWVHQTGGLVLRHHKSGLEVNLINYKREALGRVTWVDLKELAISLPNPEDPIITKIVAPPRLRFAKTSPACLVQYGYLISLESILKASRVIILF